MTRKRKTPKKPKQNQIHTLGSIRSISSREGKEPMYCHMLLGVTIYVHRHSRKKNSKKEVQKTATGRENSWYRSKGLLWGLVSQTKTELEEIRLLSINALIR